MIESETISFHHVQLNGTIWPAENPSWSRKEIGDPEAEAIWETFEQISPFFITRDDVIALGKDLETVARYPDEDFGLGEEAYIAALDIQHKIHCLNELRKTAFSDYGKTTQDDAKRKTTWPALVNSPALLLGYAYPGYALPRRCRSCYIPLDGHAAVSISRL